MSSKSTKVQKHVFLQEVSFLTCSLNLQAHRRHEQSSRVPVTEMGTINMEKSHIHVMQKVSSGSNRHQFAARYQITVL